MEDDNAEMATIRISLMLYTSGSLLAASLGVFLYKGYQERIRAIRLKRQGFVSNRPI